MEAAGDAFGQSVCFFRLREGAAVFHAELRFGVQVVESRTEPCVFDLATIHQVPEIGGVDQVQVWFEVLLEAVGCCIFEGLGGLVV